MNIEQLVQSVVDRYVPAPDGAPHSVSHADATAAVKAAVAQPIKQAPPPEQVKAAAEQIDSYLKSHGRSLDIHVDQDTGETVVTVRDANTGDVIRQIPNEETLQLAKSLGHGSSSPAILNLTV
jgi:uncharacterized FlaG/YvyC family protein